MVQMTHARIYFPATKKYAEKPITAKDYARNREEMLAREEAGEIECHCPDPHCDGVRVRLQGEHLHTYYGRAGHPYRLEIEDYFQRMQGAAEHHPYCNVVQEYDGYRRIVASLSELRTGHQSFRINMNIPSHDLAPPRRKPTKIDGAFEKAAESKYRKDSDRPRRPALSHSMSNIHGLGSLIERAAYDDHLQRNTMVHVDGKILPLREFYRETPAQMFDAGRNALQYASRRTRGLLTRADFPAATVFRPVLPGKFWVIDKQGPGQIFGQTDKVRGRDGKSYNVCTVLHVADRELFFDIRAQFNKGYQSFLVVSETNTIDLEEIRARNAEAQASKVNSAFHVHTYVNLPVQITPWTPPPDIKEMDFGGGMFDLREPPHQKKWKEQQKEKRGRDNDANRATLNELQARLL